MPTDDPRHPLIALADRHLDETFDRLEKASEPLWQGQSDSWRTLTTLSSSALVLSISVAQFLAGKSPKPEWAWLLPVAWSLFGITIILAAGQHAWLGAARSMRLHFEQRRGDIRRQVAALEESDDLSQRFDAVLEKAMDEAIAEVKESLGTYAVRSKLMFWSFFGGLIALIVFASHNLAL